MGRQIVTTTFELKDGREFKCQYAVWHYPGGYWSPPEDEVYDPEFELDGDPIAEKDLPKGLGDLAVKMYENPDDPRFKTTYDDDDGVPEDLGCE